MDYSQPFFVLGNPRSGTTLFRLMLNCHQDLVVPPECGFLQWWYKKYKEWSFTDSASTKRIEAYLADLESSRKWETWNLELDELKTRILEAHPENYATLSAMIYEAYGDGNETRWGDKNNYYIHHLGLLQEIYPDAQFIWIVRDGRDVACSYRNLPKGKTEMKYKPVLPQKIEEIAREWVANNQHVRDHFRDQLSNLHCIRYEDLLKDASTELKKVCSFLQVPFAAEMLNYYHSDPGNKTEPEALMAWKKKTRQKPDISNIGKYQQQLTEAEIDAFNSIAGTLLKHFGYAV